MTAKQEIKERIKERYGNIAFTGNSDCCCCATGQIGEYKGNSCCSPGQSATIIGYDNKELESIPQASILGVGCGAPLHFADVREAETIVDLGSGAGIDVFLSSKKVGGSGRWCSCIDGALTKENYIESIRKAGFKTPEILEEKRYIKQEEGGDNNVDDDNRRISSIIVKAVKD
jgi:hypothetical protein